ncbi:MAG: UDP-N-acetylmuramate/alanine ligase [Clostridiaceae bacterium]|nr:UDP-N-acetylmuramate/alanine ligase [Clostridiaceae bacterium]
MSLNFLSNKEAKVHFIGIGGISMSGLAEILLQKGYKVSGSDMKASEITFKLQSMGAEIYIGHKAENVLNSNLVVYTAAISQDNEELVNAKKLNIPLMSRAEFLGKIMKGHKYNVAVSGTHGKTTTTSMLSHMAIHADLDPTILVGGELDLINGNVKTGNSEYFITEACEYKKSFLSFFPFIGIILNIDADHLDFYKNLDEIEDAFYNFAKLIPNNGYLIANNEDSRIQNIIKKVNCNKITFGLTSGDFTAENIAFDSVGNATFDVVLKGAIIGKVHLNVPGKHNILNALASLSSAYVLKIPIDSAIKGLETFGGTHRRFEIKGVKNGITVIDDYAHHPTEIKATLSAALNFPHNKIFCVFQPHTYSRTFTLLNDFSKSFFNVDTLLLADIYAAREKDMGIISSKVLGDKIRELGVKCINFNDFNSIVEYLKKEVSSGDIILTIGAGDIDIVGDMFLNK